MIALKNLTLRRGTKVILDQVSVTLNPGEKVGLVGRNGSGKSSLLALLTGALHEDAGSFSVPAQWRVAQVAQHLPETSESATDFVLGGDTQLMALQQALGSAQAAGDGMAMAQLYADLADAGAHDATARAQALILGLGFSSLQLDAPVNSFSGGWRMRLQLARALMCPSELLLLDEPTNHLDLDALVWLEAWLKRYSGTLIVISHDREFLDAVTRVTLHIEHSKLVRYGGNYSEFETLRAQQLELQQASYARQQGQIAHLKKFIDRFKAKASKAKQAQSRVKALERMEKIAPVLADADFTFEFKEPVHLPNPMLTLADARLGYAGADAAQPPVVILQRVSRSVLAGQRIGILGANGQGKSTLVKTLVGHLPLLSGSLTPGKGLNIGYFAQQELDVLRPADHPLAHMIALARDVGPAAREQELRNFLGTFNFSGDMVTQSVGSMSGGEKARLVLAMIVWQRPNLLLLDEPTNHLDLATREALSMALNEFEGTVQLVSHDRALLRAVCDEFWLVGAGQVTPFDGDLEDYQRYLLDEAKRQRELARAPAAPAQPAPALPQPVQAPVSASAAASARVNPQRRKLLERDLDLVQQHIAKLEAEKSLCLQTLSQAAPSEAMIKTGQRLKALELELQMLEERWLDLAQSLEALALKA